MALYSLNNLILIYAHIIKHTKHDIYIILIIIFIYPVFLIIYDDIIDTAGTMANAVKLLKTNGAAEVYVAACHGLFNGTALQKLNNAGV